jgi:hypothetical protein
MVLPEADKPYEVPDTLDTDALDHFLAGDRVRPKVG